MNRTRRAFDYQPPSYEEATKFTERSSSRYDNYIKDGGPRFFKPKVGDNFIRILPGTWENSRHYAYPIKLHRDVGPDRQTYLCLKENDLSPEKDCPICEERYELLRRKSQQDADKLRSQTTSLVYVIDRANEDQGPILWGMSNKSDLEILAQSLEKRQQRYLPIAHPIDGYDVEFVRDGEGINTRYRGFKVARTTSPVHDNADKLEEWLNYIEDNPITEILQFFSAERIKSVFYGKSVVAKPEEEPAPYVREEVHVSRPIVEDTQPNGHDEPPFEVEIPTRRPLETSERPTPREIEPNNERRRARLDEPDAGEKSQMDKLREQLARRSSTNT